jgi:hypothetical protein
MSVLRWLTFALIVSLAVVGISSQARAGLSDAERGLLPISYQEREIGFADRHALDAYWKDQAVYADWESLRHVKVFSAKIASEDDQPLLVTTLSAAGVCGIRECPMRVFTAQGALLFEVSACDDTNQHFVSADRRNFIACEISHALPLTSEVLPPRRLASRSLWHNGSIVDAEFGNQGTLSIRYLEPRGGLGNVRGRLLFEGRVMHQHFVEGTAYTFKSGCAPAAYAVQGRIDPRGNIDLFGDAPMRDTRSCAVIGFTPFSPHARLRFVGPSFASR